MVNPIPEGTHTLTPHLVVKGAAKAIDFHTKAPGARELFRMMAKRAADAMAKRPAPRKRESAGAKIASARKATPARCSVAE